MKLYYIYDALCGWCYGFSPIMKKLYQEKQDEMPFEVLSGGMILGEREGPIGEVAPYIKQAYKTVEDKTGVQFGENFLKKLDEGTSYFTSLPAAKAMAAYKIMKDINQVNFAHAIQNAIYYDGKEPSQKDTFVSLAVELGLNKKTFEHHYDAAATEEIVKQDFQLTQSLKVQGFPTVFLEEEQQFVMIAHGYTPEADLFERYEKGKEMLLEKRNEKHK